MQSTSFLQWSGRRHGLLIVATVRGLLRAALTAGRSFSLIPLGRLKVGVLASLTGHIPSVTCGLRTISMLSTVTCTNALATHLGSFQLAELSGILFELNRAACQSVV